MAGSVATSTVEFLRCIKDHGPEAMFRGQGDNSWPLRPSIARFADLFGPDDYDSIAGLEDHLLDRFQILGVPFRDFRKLPFFEQLIHAQHYGLPTRLLDWSTNPLKALFFAVEDPRLDNTNAAVYITRPKTWYEGTSRVEQSSEFVACFPEVLHERIAAQDACVIAFPLSHTDMSLPELSVSSLPASLDFLEKIEIPASNKLPLRRQLAVLGITHRSVYPGLEGTTRWIKSDLSNFQV
jgi:hypothetical protein